MGKSGRFSSTSVTFLLNKIGCKSTIIGFVKQEILEFFIMVQCPLKFFQFGSILLRRNVTEVLLKRPLLPIFAHFCPLLPNFTYLSPQAKSGHIYLLPTIPDLPMSTHIYPCLTASTRFYPLLIHLYPPLLYPSLPTSTHFYTNFYPLLSTLTHIY
jgi:hypothetical protein